MSITDKGSGQSLASVLKDDVSARSEGEHKPGRVVSMADVITVMGIPEAELTPKVGEAILSLMTEVDQLRHDLEALRRRLQEAEVEADLDPLVPTLNRRAFVRELSRVISFSERYSFKASLVYFDLNDFKKINDDFGHACGDMVLLHVANVLAENVRESDVVGRLGGDEFGVILARADEQVAATKAEQLRNAIAAKPASFESREIYISVTPGVSTFRAGDDAGAALDRADQAMYERKHNKSGAD